MIKLGEKYKDKISGFEGVATARTVFLFGCVRVCLESKKLKDDGTPQECWFDEQRLTSKSKGTKSKGRTGGPGPNPPKRNSG